MTMTEKELDNICNQLELERQIKQDIQMIKAKAELDTITRETVAYYDGLYDAIKSVKALMAKGGADNG